jgi:hypothetical protein
MRAAVFAMTVLLTVALAAPATASAAPPTTPLPAGKKLPLDGFGDLLVVPPHDTDGGHLIVAGGDANTSAGARTGIVETDLTGHHVTTVGDLSSVVALALAPDLHTVYAATPDDEIVSFDASSPADVSTYVLGDSVCPHDLAVAGDGTVWFSYGCDAGVGDLGTLDPVTGEPTLGLAAGLFPHHPLTAAPLLANTAGHPDTIVVGEPVPNGLLAVLDTSGAQPSVVTSTTVSDAADLDVAADGASVLVAAPHTGATDARRYSTADLSHVIATYRADQPDAVATSADGAYTAVVASGRTISSYGTVDEKRVETMTADSEHGIEPRAITWTGHELLAVSVDLSSNAVHVAVLPYLTSPPMTITGLSAPKKGQVGQPLAVTGTASAHGVPVADTPLDVVRTDPEGSHTLPAVMTDADGKFVLTDRPKAGPQVTYTVSHALDAHYGPASASVAVAVHRLAATLQISSDKNRYKWLHRARITVHLGPTHNNRTVQLRENEGQGWSVLADGPVDKHGDLTAQVRMVYTTKFQAAFDGDTRYQPQKITIVRGAEAQVQLTMSGYYKTSGRQYVYHVGDHPQLNANIQPARGSCLYFRDEIRAASGWVHSERSRCHKSPNGEIAASFVPPRAKAGRSYRLRVEWDGDKQNVASVSKWAYFELSG